ncbi:MAG: hypothetical protein U0Q15_09330 [Kineosporiaceae bacterium]
MLSIASTQPEGVAVLDGDPISDPVAARVAEIETAFGDPWDAGSALPFAAVLAADDAHELPAAGARLVRELGLGAELVPARLGGRMRSMDAMTRLLRPVLRRDASLAMSCGLTSFTGSAVVWVSGTAAQQARTAAELLAGGQLGVLCPQTAHGNDYFAEQVALRPDGTGWLLAGRKSAVNNADTARLLLAFATTPGADGAPDGDTVLLIDRDTLPADGVHHLGRNLSDGARGQRQGALELRDVPVGEDAAVGPWGLGFLAAIPAFAMLNAVYPGVVVGMADSALRVAARTTADGEGPCAAPGGGPRALTALGGAFVDVLVADALSLVACRAVHVLPGECDVVASVAKYLVPKLVTATLHRLTVVLGDGFHASGGAQAMLAKHVRDLGQLTFGHVNTALCQATIAPHLARVASVPWTAEHAAPAPLFAVAGDVPEFDPGALAAMGGLDGIASVIDQVLRELPAAPAPALASAGPAWLATLAAADDDLLPSLVRELAAEAAVLRGTLVEQYVEGTGFDATGAAEPRALAATDRYALLLAAASCLGVWRSARAGLGSEGRAPGFLADDAWVTVAVHRLLRQLNRQVAPLPRTLEARMADEVLTRVREGVSLDLYADRVAG